MIVALKSGHFVSGPAPASAKHPAATLGGVVYLDQMLQGSMAWGRATPLQRSLLMRACDGLEAAVEAGGVVEAPLLPTVPDRTWDSLARKGLVEAGGRLTPVGVLAAVHGPRLAEQERQRRGKREQEVAS